MNKTLSDFARDNPGSVQDGFLLVIGRRPGFDNHCQDGEDAPWALFASRQAAEEVVGKLTGPQLAGGCYADGVEAGDEIVAELVEFRQGQRYSVSKLRRWEITREDIRAFAATLPKWEKVKTG
jgi:hypothetical protein